MRGREFVMKDAYSFHADQASLDAEYQNMYDAYVRIFTRCGLQFRAVEADTGSIGGSASHEFMVLAASGEDEILFSDACDYAANVEKATFRRGEGPIGKLPSGAVAEVATPGQKSIEDVARFLGVSAQELIKTLVFETSEGFVLACCTGDRELCEAKVKNAAGAAWAHLADPDLVKSKFGAPVGYLGPVKFPALLKILVDLDVIRLQSGYTGANKPDYHLGNVVPRRDFSPSVVADLVNAKAGDPCPRSLGKLASARGIEVGHVFKLGAKYSEKLKVEFLDDKGRTRPMIMGCYGIGIGRTAAAAIEQNHDDKGIIWPTALAPFAVAVVPLDLRNADLMTAAEQIYGDLCDAGLTACLDDRDERPGVKLKDCELLGIPYRIVIGKRGFEAGMAEITERRGGVTEEIALADAAAFVRKRLAVD
jgi:prolyl-tRNA synthetase